MSLNYVSIFSVSMDFTLLLFVSSVSREQCREANAVICFTLMDYDVITANDFGGEAFISLR
jgi:hypothetical protein